MRSKFIVLAAFAALSLNGARASASMCIDNFRSVDERHLALALEVKAAGVADQAYVTSWQVKDPSKAGPFPMKGEMTVVPVTNDQLPKWMDEVGKHSIGISVYGLPESSPGTGSMRVGDQFYVYNQIQGGYGPQPFTQAASYQTFTEITIPVSDVELKAIHEFIRARGAKEILAKSNIRGGPRAGEPIFPAFDSHKFTLCKESCAAATSSWMDPKWLAHYEGPGAQVLRDMHDRLKLTPTFVAKQLIWGHVRNPDTSMVTLINVNRSQRVGMLRDFMQVNEWGHLRGLQIFAMMPDSRKGETSTVVSSRKPLNQWLAEHGNP